MKMTYIQFEMPKHNSEPSKDGPLKTSVKNTLESLLQKIFPLANPDFDDKIEDVKYWLVECDDETGVPQRKVGLDKEGDAGRVRQKMTFRRKKLLILRHDYHISHQRKGTDD